MATNGGDGWSALFLPASSPGQVIRWLERRHRRAGDPVPDGLLLSDAVGPNRLRALAGGPDTRPWMEQTAPLFAEALTGNVTLLWRDPSRWGYGVWGTGDAEPERAEATVTEPPARGLLARLTRAPLPPPAEVTWARTRGLPWDRIPALRPARAGTLPVIGYATVARLDQKSLLVEDGPRLYRFALPAAPGL